jgi:hypothetical protein
MQIIRATPKTLKQCSKHPAALAVASLQLENLVPICQVCLDQFDKDQDVAGELEREARDWLKRVTDRNGNVLGRSPEKVPSYAEINEKLAQLSRTVDIIGDKSKNLTDEEATILKAQFDAEAMAGRKPRIP